MAQSSPLDTSVNALHGLFPVYQAPVTPLQAAQQGFHTTQSSLSPLNFMKPVHVKPNSTPITPGQYQSVNTLSAENLPTLLQMLGRR